MSNHKIQIGANYRHKKNGSIYHVVNIGEDRTRDELGVFYTPIRTPNELYYRELFDFQEKFELVSITIKEEKLVFNGRLHPNQYRFNEYIMTYKGKQIKVDSMNVVIEVTSEAELNSIIDRKEFTSYTIKPKNKIPTATFSGN